MTELIKNKIFSTISLPSKSHSSKKPPQNLRWICTIFLNKLEKHHVTLTNGSEMAQNSLINPFLNLLKGTLSLTILISSLNLFFLSPINYGSKKLILNVSVLKTNSQKWTTHWNKISKKKLEPDEFWWIKNKIRHVRFSVSCIR